MELKCEVQEYAWGKIGQESQVALLAKNRPDFEIQANTPYAELWMGTHPNGPSKIMKSGQPLDVYIKEHPDVLGVTCREQFGNTLPFLFKILSVNKALSIQAHPNKELAAELHKDRPNIYKDPNHKPEMAIALTEFQGLCGFRPLQEIKKNCEHNSQLRQIIGEDAINDIVAANKHSYPTALKNCFTLLMKCKKETILTNANELKQKIIAKEVRDELDNLFLQLNQQYPGDVGCFVIYFLNLVSLSPGEAMFLGPNVPHAYLSGDCVECMACSDNVVRAGLTPKLIDVEVLCAMLEYVCTEGEKSVKFPSRVENPSSVLYEAPVPDFSVAKLLVNSQFKSVPRSNCSIVINVKGQGNYKVYNGGSAVSYSSGQLETGTVLFLGAKDVLEIETKNDVVCYQAFC
jgi:mannose-6-phosphate isomerase